MCGDIKSIFVPDGQKITLYNIAQFKGEKATFTKSVECLPEVNFELLSLYGMKIHKVEDKQSGFAEPSKIGNKTNKKFMR